MSDELRKTVSVQVILEEDVPAEKKAQSLQTAIFETGKTHPFLGSVLQCLNISYSFQIPRAGIMFNTDNKRWDMLINPKWFCDKLAQKERKAVLLHELGHITNKHPMRAPFLKINKHKRALMNVAMDMAINQFIKDLPQGCKECPPIEAQQLGARCKNKTCPGSVIMVEHYFDFDAKGNKVPWATNKPMEHYYEKLIERFEEPEDDGDEGEPGEGEGQGDGQGGGGQGKGKPNQFDTHSWESNVEEESMLDATEDLMKRAMIKRGLSYDELPQSVKELLEEIKARKTELNYRALILAAIKRSASGHDRKHSWSRKSKRFGNKAPGTRVSELPHLDIYIDTSGSISIEEANEFLGIVDQFLKAGSRKCTLNMFHTANYYREDYRLGKRIERKEFQSGGTDLTASMQVIAQTRPDLAVFLTDGCYGDVDVEKMVGTSNKFSQCLFIISRNGTTEHPLKRLGKTIKIPDTNVMASDKELENK